MLARRLKGSLPSGLIKHAQIMLAHGRRLPAPRQHGRDDGLASIVLDEVAYAKGADRRLGRGRPLQFLAFPDGHPGVRPAPWHGDRAVERPVEPFHLVGAALVRLRDLPAEAGRGPPLEPQAARAIAHPSDLFDVQGLLASKGMTEPLRQAFLA